MKGTYQTLSRETFDLTDLSRNERELLTELEAKQASSVSFQEYANEWMPRVAKFYEEQNLTRKQIVQMVVWKIVKDLGSRLMIRLKDCLPPHDYRDDLDHLIREHFPTRKAFCDATGIAEDMLSHVLSRRKHLSIDTLAEALSRIGYRIQISPVAVE